MPPALPAFPLPVPQERSLTARQAAKPVLQSRLLDDMEASEHWRGFGPGKIQFTTARKQDGRQSIQLTSPTKGTEPPRVQGRPFGETGARREFQQEDWSAFNRLSVWVYPDLPGFRVISMLIKLHSEGTEGRSYTDGGLHFVLLKNQQWNQVLWEISHLDRKQVCAVELIYRLQGNEPGATEEVTFYFDKLELQRVVPSQFRGWMPDADTIAYSHPGYLRTSPKVVIGPPENDSVLQVLREDSGKVVWSGKPRQVRTPTGTQKVYDFSSLRKQGTFRLRMGDLTTPPFAISSDPLREATIAGLNFFFCQRCGFSVKGIHDVCHRDWRAEHAGRTLPINGGWHDAGDLSQGLVNTAEAGWAMLRLASRVHKSDPELAHRFREEARWGVEWLLKTRFGNGFRVNWATMDFWTDGVLGNVDDVTVRAGDSAFENFIAASTEAVAARVFRRLDSEFAERCQKAAEADYAFAMQKSIEPGLELAAAAAQASIELFKMRKDNFYRSNALHFANLIIACQERDQPRWDTPLSGFFYSSPKRERILHYNHRSHEQAPVMALADMCDLFDHPNRSAWRAAVQAYGDYLVAASRHTAPFHMIPAGIYRLADTSDAGQRKQIQEGIRLADGVYLRRFPIWGDFRGNLGVQLSQASAAARAARLLKSSALERLAREQLEWTLGRNPFGQSLMYGIGHDYAPQYTAMSGDISGSLPVGIQTRLHEDVPYWPTANCYNYSEVWVHPVTRFFTTISELSR